MSTQSRQTTIHGVDQEMTPRAQGGLCPPRLIQMTSTRSSLSMTTPTFTGPNRSPARRWLPRFSLAVCVALGLLCSQAVFALGSSSWRQVDSSGQMATYRRDHASTKFQEYKVVVETAVKPEQIIAAIQDWKKHAAFFPHVIEKRVFNVGARQYAYTLVDPPMGSKRDYVTRLEERRQAGRYELRFHEAPGVGPAPSKSVVRLPMLRGYWRVEPGKSGGSRLTYVLACDPGGSVTTWIADRSNKRAAVTSVEALLDWVKR